MRQIIIPGEMPLAFNEPVELELCMQSMQVVKKLGSAVFIFGTEHVNGYEALAAKMDDDSLETLPLEPAEASALAVALDELEKHALHVAATGYAMLDPLSATALREMRIALPSSHDFAERLPYTD